MVNLVLGSKLLSEVQTAYRINLAHEYAMVEVKINNIKTGLSVRVKL